MPAPAACLESQSLVMTLPGGGGVLSLPGTREHEPRKGWEREKVHAVAHCHWREQGTGAPLVHQGTALWGANTTSSF